MDNSELVGTVFLDLSKAFDLVNHDILLAKLAKFHTDINTLDWFRSYLTGRTQVVTWLFVFCFSLEVVCCTNIHQFDQFTVVCTLLDD